MTASDEAVLVRNLARRTSGPMSVIEVPTSRLWIENNSSTSLSPTAAVMSLIATSAKSRRNLGHQCVHGLAQRGLRTSFCKCPGSCL